MDSYVNIKAIQSAKLTLKGYSETDTGRGLAWSCKVYLQNKKIGLVKDPGDGGITTTDVPIDTQISIVTALKRSAYAVRSKSAEHSVELLNPSAWFVTAVAQMVDEVASLRQLKRLAKTHLIVRLKSSENEFEFYKIAPSKSSQAKLLRQLGDDLISFMNDEIRAL